MPVKDTNIPEDVLQRMRLKGRVSGSEHIKGKSGGDGYFQTFVTVPAPDIYTHPSTFGVNASSPLGPDGQDVDVFCQVRPFTRRHEGRLYCNNSLWLFTPEQEKRDVSF